MAEEAQNPAEVPAPNDAAPSPPSDGEPRTSEVLTEAVAEAIAQKARETEEDAAVDSSQKKQGCCSSRLQRFEQCLDGLPFPPSISPPQCLRREGRTFRSFEANRCCFGFGRLGCQLCGNFRKLLLLVSLFLSTIGVFLRALPAAALSTDRGNLHAYPWAYGDYSCLQQSRCGGLEAQIYIGLESLLVDAPSFQMYKAIPWAADDCVANLSSLGAGSYCSICRDASRGCAAMAFLSIACSIFNIWADIQRMRAKNDHNCIKAVAIVSNILGALQLMLAVSIFQSLCVAEFPLEDSDQTFRISLNMGRGGALIASACVINVFNVIVHWAIAVPEARWKSGAAMDPAPPNFWPSIDRPLKMQSVLPEAAPHVAQGWVGDDPAKALVPVRDLESAREQAREAEAEAGKEHRMSLSSA